MSGFEPSPLSRGDAEADFRSVLFTHRPSWLLSAGLASLSIYGPFLAMATYTLSFVSCGHCKVTVWKMLPCAPAVVPFEFARQLLSLPRLSHTAELALVSVVSSGLVLALAWLIRQNPWVRVTSVTLALAVFSVCAVCVLAMIRA